MNSVFRKGDVVYHPTLGVVTVSVVGEYQCNTNLGWLDNRGLSFSPWPAPNHERPFTEVGWWIVAFFDGSMGVRWRYQSDEYRLYKDKLGGETNTKPSHWTGRYVKFLGTEL